MLDVAQSLLATALLGAGMVFLLRESVRTDAAGASVAVLGAGMVRCLLGTLLFAAVAFPVHTAWRAVEDVIDLCSGSVSGRDECGAEVDREPGPASRAPASPGAPR